MYNWYQDNQIDATNTEISATENIISGLKNNPQILAYSLLQKAKPAINQEIFAASAQRYLAQLDQIARKFFRQIEFSGFAFADKKVTTSAIAYGFDQDAAKNVISLLKEYRGTSTNDSMFSLEPVLSVSGDATKRTFGVTFDVKSSALSATGSQVISTGLQVTSTGSQTTGTGITK